MADWDADGFQIADDLVGPVGPVGPEDGELAFLKATHDRLFAEARRRRVTRETDDRFRVTLERIYDPSEECPALRDTRFFRQGRARAAALLRAEDVQAVLVLMRKPAGAPSSPLHQHAAVPRPEARALSLWMPLVAAGPDNGGLLVVPGSHGTLLPHDRFARLLPPLPAPLPLALGAGQAVFLHERLIHGASENPTATARAALLLYVWVAPRPA